MYNENEGEENGSNEENNEESSQESNEGSAEESTGGEASDTIEESGSEEKGCEESESFSKQEVINAALQGVDQYRALLIENHCSGEFLLHLGNAIKSLRNCKL
jgi:hypothetical protein